uniref:ABC-type branched-chain amino acid transport system, substrate-binding protein n=1 Tax=Candidatus Kentrum sp. TUN TaxID=2126343 RepID=A0A450ZI85_9GAMM|nr:MAG: ABC-type branched-chain amino acid transport system, substrate-binding protein [Candidatus Kentron sp. TUN]VFK55661.1 MAG: ABC-type branched-chain amino acid transport system, substrate-binding protein [Candidatus Kentron sp. TUN]
MNLRNQNQFANFSRGRKAVGWRLFLQTLKGIIFCAAFYTASLPLFTILPGTIPNANGADIQGPKIYAGMSVPLTGESKNLGIAMRDGVKIYFDKINTLGGIKSKGKTYFLELIVKDDGYEPDSAAENMHEFASDGRIIGVVGNVGTPTAAVTLPIANKKKLLLFGAFTGAGLLRKEPPDRYVINYRASYAEETAEMVKALLRSGIAADEIAYFTQNDSYGDAGFDGAMQALESAGQEIPKRIAHGRYTRNTSNIELGYAEILRTYMQTRIRPKAFILVGTAKPCARFIKLAKMDFPDAYYLNVSFVGTVALKKELGEKGKRVIITQVVPYIAKLNGKREEIVDQYVEDIGSFNERNGKRARKSYVSLEGYIVASIFTEGLKKALDDGKEINRETIIDALETLSPAKLGIENLAHLSKSEHQFSHRIWATHITEYKVKRDEKTIKRIGLRPFIGRGKDGKIVMMPFSD